MIGSECPKYILETLNDPDRAREIRVIAEDSGLSIEAVTIEDGLLVAEQKLKTDAEDLEPYVNLCLDLGAKVLCFLKDTKIKRPTKVPEFLCYTMRIGLKQLDKYAKRKEVRIAIGNNPELPVTAKDFKTTLLSDNLEQIGICFDPINFRRANVSINEAVNALSDRIFHVCFRDLPLKVGESKGCINYCDLVKTLRKIKYDGLVSVRIIGASRNLGMDPMEVYNYLSCLIRD
ncbi:hypothetical protein AKJ45_02445 [candidate division MSBL1 archaeon SCGC-AAA261F19]|uniref:Xylose isomerase-like TIM barrel domain-containing protein n=1 Tax=candidate division MSBL1 archaeon SCGC-AAA261F19 TaxID=1698275 RepID=A0A133V9H6_9EURY|nr:hypothetical protein AKJ45_02445 [candidate division MSBL1 archaeon SCGC-AAA261F19]